MYTEYFVKLDYRCNNHCQFCITAEHDSFMKMEEIIKMIDLIDKNRFDTITLSGGEPSLRNDFIDILTYIKENGYKIKLQTNGRKFAAAEFARKVAEIGIESYLISFHGDIKESFEYITQVPNSYIETLQGIRNIKSFGQYVISNTVINRYNYNKLYDIAIKMTENNVDEIKFVWLRCISENKEIYDKFSVTFEETKKELDKALEYCMQQRKKTLVEGIPFCQVQKHMKSVGELYIPHRLDFASKDEKKQNIYYTGMFYEKGAVCEECNFTNICGGTWKEYVYKYGDKEFESIKNVSPFEVMDVEILCNKLFD